METHNHDDPAYIEMRREYTSRLFGTAPGSFSPAAYSNALAATRALPRPPSCRTGGGLHDSLNNLLPWTFPVPPPLGNDWGGGASARIDAIAVHPTDGNTVYVSSEGGLAKSTDGGTNWSYLSDSLSSQSIRSIAIDPIAPNIIYAGNRYPGILWQGNLPLIRFGRDLDYRWRDGVHRKHRWRSDPSASAGGQSRQRCMRALLGPTRPTASGNPPTAAQPGLKKG